MRVGVVIAGLAGAVLLSTAGHAAAQSQSGARARTPAVTLADAQNAQGSRPAPQQRRGLLRWMDSGRWGLDLNMNQPVGRETQLGDVQAGAYYSLSPRLRVGASAGLAAPEQDPARAAETDRRGQPRVRLESIFKF